MKKQAFNPILPLSEYIPDGEPHVFGDRVYLYGSQSFEGEKLDITKQYDMDGDLFHVTRDGTLITSCKISWK